MDEKPSSQNRTKRPTRRKRETQDTFNPHPTYPKLNMGYEEGKGRRKPRPRVRKVRLSSTAAIGAGSTVSRGFGHGLLGDIRNGRIPSFLGLVAMIFLGYWLLTAPNFRVTNVQVKNGRFLEAKDVVASTGVDQQNIFMLNESEIAGKIKKLPYVLDAEVVKALPNSLTVQVKERVSMLNWRVGSTNYLVDPDGVVLETMVQLPANAANYTAIKSLDDKPLKIGDKVDPVAVRSAPLIVKKLEEISFGTASLDYSPTNGLIAMGIKEQGSRKIVLGTDAELDKKMSILKSLMADQSLKWTFADLRFTAKPAIQ